MLRRRIHIISIIDDLHFGGDEYRLLTFAQTVDSSRFQHTVVTLMAAHPESDGQYGSMRNQYREAGVRVLDLGQPSLDEARRQGRGKLRMFGEKVRKLKALIRDERADILDVHLAPANPICAAAVLGSGVPFAITLYQLTTMRSALLWLAGQFNLACAKLLITDSQAQAGLIRKWLIRCPKIRVIPNGTTAPQTSLPREHLLKALNIPSEPGLTVIAQISGLVSYKGHLVLLDAAKEVLSQHRQCIFLFVGFERSETGRREFLLGRAGELGIADKVRIAGYPGNIGDVWSIVDIHVHASLLDSLPNALLEAMAVGKPSVITSVGGIPEVIEHCVNGLLVPSNNAHELAQNLLLLLENPSLRARLGEAARATHVERFSPEVMTRKIERSFEDIARPVE